MTDELLEIPMLIVSQPTGYQTVLAMDIERDRSRAELSFWIAAEFWGQGYMSEALKPVIAFGFNHLSLNRLYAYHMLRNPGSGKVLQKNGFVQEEVLRQRVRKWGVFEDVALWAMLRKDWLESSR